MAANKIQKLLSFTKTSNNGDDTTDNLKDTELPYGFLDTFDGFMSLHHGNGSGVRNIQDANGAGGGYMVTYADRTTSVHYPGIVGALKKKFGNPIASAMIENRRSASRKNGASSRQKGNLIHRHIYHQIECVKNMQYRTQTNQTTGRCLCPAGVQTPDKSNEQARRLLQSIDEFGWISIHSELAIISDSMNLVTRTDLLAFDARSRTFVLVSWKTGYKDIESQITCGNPLSNATTKSQPGRNEHYMNSPLDMVPDNERERNQLQLLCEYMILKKEYQLEISKAVVIYIHFDKSDLNRKIIDNAAWWWWNREELQENFWNVMTSDKKRN